MHQRFIKEIFIIYFFYIELQNRNLASEEFLSTDDDEDLDEDSDVDEMGKNLESMLQSKMNTTENNASNPAKNNASNGSSANPSKPMDSSTELKNLIMDRTGIDSSDQKSAISKNQSSAQTVVPPNMHRVLKITRTYRDEETGQEYTKVETVKKPLIIDAYVKIRSTKDDDFIKSAFALDEDEKEKLRKERRRLQEQLRRVKRNEAKRANNDDQSPDVNGTYPVHKVRKYTKTGAPRKPKTMTKLNRQMAIGSGENTGQSIPSPDNHLPVKRPYNKSSLHYSSADDEKSMHFGGGEHGDQSQSNMLDTTASSLNNTLTNPLGVVKKRKYQKRKKLELGPDGLPLPTPPTDPNQLSSGTAGISKVEGTKLIIQKKAIKMALSGDRNSELFGNTSIEGAPGTAKKPRISKKMKQQQQQQLESSLMVVDTSSTNLDASSNLNDTNNADPNASLQAPKLKIINKNKLNKPKPSLILHIPKEKLALASTSSSNNNQTLDNGGGTNSGTSNSVANSPSVDVTSINSDQVNSPSLPHQQQTPSQPVKRQYNKQNSLIKKQQKMMLQQQQQFELNN